MQNQNEDYLTEEDYKNISDVIENKVETVGILKNSFRNDEEKNKKKNEFIEAFRFFDKDNTGFISSAEITYMLQNHGGMSLQDIRTLFGTEIYKNNGFINYEHFIDRLFGD